MDPRDAPTPRQSNSWHIGALARGLAEQLRTQELALGQANAKLDTRRASMLRALRMVMEHYGAMVRPGELQPQEMARAQREFSAAVALAQVVLAPEPA